MKIKQFELEELTKKRGLTSLIGVILFVVITVISTLTYSGWFTTFNSEKLNDVEQTNRDVILILDSIGSDVYLKSQNNNSEITNIEISGKDCNVITTLQRGINKINLGNCVDGMDGTKQEIVVFTKKGVYAKIEILREVPEFPQGSIGNCDQLLSMYEDLDGTYYLTKNLYCFESKSWNNGEGFIPIGSEDSPFTGEIYGNENSIYGISVNSNEKYGGFFGNLNNATISDLNLIGIDITGQRYTGGLAGYAQNSIIKNVHIQGDISGEENHNGGVIGYLTNSMVLESSYSNGLVNGSEEHTGGLVGHQRNSVIRNSYSKGDVYSNEKYAGGLIGYQINSTLETSFSSGQVFSNEEDNVGGLIGYSQDSIIISSFWDINSSNLDVSAAGSGKTTDEMFNETTFNLWDFNSIWNEPNNNYPSLK